MSRFDIDDDETAFEQPPELKLWCAALALYISDAMEYAREKNKSIDAQIAYRDITTDGEILRYLCEGALRDAKRIKWMFRLYLRKLVESDTL